MLKNPATGNAVEMRIGCYSSSVVAGVVGLKIPRWLKFIYSEKAAKFWEISTLDLSYIVPVKSSVEISQNFVAFSEYMNFKKVKYIDPS